MTEEQRRKAILAKTNNDIDEVLERLERGIALSNHKTALEWVNRLNLPYRISLDYLKQEKPKDGTIPLNPYYPRAGVPLDKAYRVDVSNIEPRGDFPAPNAEEMKKIREYNKQFVPWNLSTPEGRTIWEYNFSHFLVGYDFDKFTAFDMFGSKDHDDLELQSKKKYYKELQKRFAKNPQDFRTEEPICKEEDDIWYATQEYWLDIPKDDYFKDMGM